MPELSTPVLDDELPTELKRKFHELFNEAYELLSRQQGNESVQAAALLFHHHVKEEVSAYPILARTLYNIMHEWSLLEVVCVK